MDRLAALNGVYRPRTTRSPVELVLQVALVAVLIALLVFMGHFALVVVPEIRDAAASLKATQEEMGRQNDAERKRHEQILAARERESELAARMLILQESNVKLADRLNKKLLETDK